MRGFLLDDKFIDLSIIIKMKKQIIAEYIWIDGKKPTAKLRSKSKVIDGPVEKLEQIPAWGFDGSSTEQAEGHFSDCLLKPVYFVPDPVRGGRISW